MKTKKFIIIVSMLLSLSFMVSCGVNKDGDKLSQEALNICGSWAYIHDRETAVAVFQKNGKAEYNGEKFSFDCDNQFIYLKGENGDTTSLRYQLDDEGMYLYQNTTYTYQGEGVPDGVIGQWICPETNWSFEFTDAGTFMEDGIFPGIYVVDEEEKTCRLIYNDQFEDTVCFYHIEGNELYLEYPWRMVKMDTN